MTTPTLTLSRIDNRTWMLLLDLGGRSISLPLDRSSDPIALATSICGLIAESGAIRVTVDADHVAPSPAASPAAKVQPALTEAALLEVIKALTRRVSVRTTITPTPATVYFSSDNHTGTTSHLTT